MTIVIDPFAELQRAANVLHALDHPRRETFIKPAPQRVLLWRIISRDEDENYDLHGELISDDDRHFWVKVDGEGEARPFAKKTATGVTLWRIQRERVSS